MQTHDFTTGSLSYYSTADICERKGTYTASNIRKIEKITTRLEEIQLLLKMYRINWVPNNSDVRDCLVDHLRKRARHLRREDQQLRLKAKVLTRIPLISKSQALENRNKMCWFDDKNINKAMESSDREDSSATDDSEIYLSDSESDSE